MTESLTRIAIINSDKCKPKKCNQECKKSCPVVKMGKLCVEVDLNSKIAKISEELCIGCGICVKKCPFDAINIINIPKELEKETVHRYGLNSFKLHRLPVPRPRQVLGLVGQNGTGKSTALKILAGKLKPNLGRYDDVPEWKEILNYFRGNELQNYLSKLIQGDVKVLIKPQYVEHISKAVKGKVRDILTKKDDMGILQAVLEDLDLNPLLDREISQLSGGELQRFAICVLAIQNADFYMFDEPSSYLDIKQRLRVSKKIRDIAEFGEKYVVVVEHDLSVLDYLSDFICVLYGKPASYGVVSMPFSVREGINIFLAGFIPTENLRFREEELTFKVCENIEEKDFKAILTYTYPSLTKTLGNFKLSIEGGSFTNSEIVVMLGQNGTGKTTFIRLLAGLLNPDENLELPVLNVSYKPQQITPKFNGTVKELLYSKIRSSFSDPRFNTDVVKPLKIEEICDQEIKNLSGGELQRVALVLALGKPADIYLIDEPSAYLDSEQRIITAKVIKRFITNFKKSAFIVEHDFIMATYLADKVIFYSGEPSINTVAHSPQSLLSGMNRFLKNLEVTFRRDPTNHRPRINKTNSLKDQEQKKAGTYFYVDVNNEEEQELEKRISKKRKENNDAGI